MSLSNPTNFVNPAAPYFFEWAASMKNGGYLYRYDKTDKKDIQLKLPFTFVVLDQLHCVSGFLKSIKSGLWSNDVRNLGEEIMTVKHKNGVEAKGLYSNIKGSLPKGWKYGKRIYIAFFNEENKLAIGQLMFAGAPISPWIEFCKQTDLTKFGVQVTGFKDAVNGDIEYKEPVFKKVPISAETLASAIELDKVLQEYLTGYLKSSGNPQGDTQTEPQDFGNDTDEYKPSDAELEEARQFNAHDAELLAASATGVKLEEEESDLPF